jgi:hypothetical protein
VLFEIIKPTSDCPTVKSFPVNVNNHHRNIGIFGSHRHLQRLSLFIMIAHCSISLKNESIFGKMPQIKSGFQDIFAC